MKLAAVIVETRDLPNLKEIIDSHMSFLPNDTQLIIYHSLKNIYLRVVFPEANCVLLEYKIDHYSYNSLLTSKRFWEDLFEYDRVLIFQSDSMLLREGIEEFINDGADFYGAVWAWNKEYIGNGGLSLRNPKIMYKLLCLFERTSSLNEDHWFCKKMFENNIGKLATKEMAAKFSVEAVFSLNSFGCHAISRYFDKEKCNLIKNQYK